jgi:hypothetical protein
MLGVKRRCCHFCKFAKMTLETIRKFPRKLTDNDFFLRLSQNCKTRQQLCVFAEMFAKNITFRKNVSTNSRFFEKKLHKYLLSEKQEQMAAAA